MFIKASTHKHYLVYLILLCFILFEVPFAQSKNIFVSTTGNDQNNGLSLTSPFATINKAINYSAAGDTIYILSGTYREVIDLNNKKGIAEKPIYIYGYSQQPLLRPVIDGGAVVPSLSASNIWMSLQNSEWIEIGNIVFKNGWADPIFISNSSYITFNGCYFFGGRRVITASGINTHHLLVQNCYWDQGGSFLWTFNEGGIDAAWTKMHDGSMAYYNGSLIHFYGTGGSIVIRSNTIVNAFNGIRWSAQKNYDSNIEIYDNEVSNIRDNDFEPEYYTFNLHIYHNHSHNIHKTLSVDHVNGGYIYYYGNRITSDKDSWSNSIASSFWKVYGDANGNLSYPLYAFNNSFCGVGKSFSMDAGTIPVQVKHFNNAYYYTGSRSWNLDYWDATDEFDYDISNKDWPGNIKNNSQEAHGKYIDVKFVDVQNFNLKLQPNSPAKDAGKIISLPEFGWIHTFDGSAPDIGAYEGDQLIDGPAFRFRTLPELNLTYKEKPRIVKSRVTRNKLELYFSETIDPSTVSVSSVILNQGSRRINIAAVSVSSDKFKIEIQSSETIDADLIAVNFNPLPKGMNGEDATLWAAALNVSKKEITTSVKNSNLIKNNINQPELDIYPNPFNSQTKIILTIPSEYVASENISFKIYDVLGRKVKELNADVIMNKMELLCDSGSLSSGVYYVVLNLNKQIISKKIILLK